MFDQKLKERQPVITNFFESAIKSDQLHHAYMLTGSNTLEQYYVAMQVAKVLNCKEKIANCKCTNCSWIDQNTHPAVITISPIDYTYGNNDSKGSTVISVNQARYLINTLSTSSPYKRVIIFTDAVEGKEHSRQAEIMWKDYAGLLNPPARTDKTNSNDDRASWIPIPIKYQTFNPATPNALLKTLEEPNPNIVFFFLTRNEEDMLDTIVSRCQTIPVLARNIERDIPDIMNDILDRFPPKTYGEAMALSEKLLEISKQESYGIEELLNSLQEYLRKLIKSNLENKSQISCWIHFIEKIESAKLELTSYVTPQAVMDSLFLSFANN